MAADLTHRSMELNPIPRYTPKLRFLKKVPKQTKGGKIAFLLNVVEEIGYPIAQTRNEPLPTSHISHKNELKIDCGLRCKM